VLNVVVLRGRILRPVEERELPSGGRVVSFDLTVRREGVPAETVPIAWLDPPASALLLVPDDEVWVVGRVKRRFFQAGGGTQSRTEVVAEAVVKVGQAKRAEAAIARALEAVDAARSG
jgi:single-strand DNA-binding protein